MLLGPAYPVHKSHNSKTTVLTPTTFSPCYFFFIATNTSMKPNASTIFFTKPNHITNYLNLHQFCFRALGTKIQKTISSKSPPCCTYSPFSKPAPPRRPSLLPPSIRPPSPRHHSERRLIPRSSLQGTVGFTSHHTESLTHCCLVGRNK